MPLPVVLVAPSYSISVAPLAFQSSAILWPRLIARAVTPAPRPLPTALLSQGARLAWLAAPLRVSREPQPRKASQTRRASAAAEALHRRRDKHRRRVRRATKRSTWREIQCQAPAARAMWACCADSSSEDDEHNTSNTLLLLFADALVAPALLADFRDFDELIADSPWTFSPVRSRIGPFLNPIIWLTILDVISGSEARLRLGLQATARVDVHLSCLPERVLRAGSRERRPPWLLELALQNPVRFRVARTSEWWL